MQYGTGSAYVVAHEDDWQLFMEPNVGQDLIRDDHLTMIIHLTAGDAGLANDFWHAREQGVFGSIRYRIAPIGTLTEEHKTIEINDHKIRCWSATIDGKHSVECYFFRLPDGNAGGIGFPRYGNQSLFKLLNKEIPSLSSVDSEAKYESWADLVETISNLVLKRSQDIGSLLVHHQEPDPAFTPKDHNDHRTSGRAVADGKLPQLFTRWSYQGYNISNYPADLTNDEMFWKVSMFATYDQEVYNLSHVHHSTLAETPLYVEWCLHRSRYRVFPPNSSHLQEI